MIRRVFDRELELDGASGRREIADIDLDGQKPAHFRAAGAGNAQHGQVGWSFLRRDRFEPDLGVVREHGKIRRRPLGAPKVADDDDFAATRVLAARSGQHGGRGVQGGLSIQSLGERCWPFPGRRESHRSWLEERSKTGRTVAVQRSRFTASPG